MPGELKPHPNPWWDEPQLPGFEDDEEPLSDQEVATLKGEIEPIADRVTAYLLLLMWGGEL